MTDFRARAIEMLRSRTETVEVATARRRAEFERLTNPDPEVIEAAQAILAAGRKARGLDADDVPRDVRGRALDPTSMAARIVAAARKMRGET